MAHITPNTFFPKHDGELFAEDVSLDQIAQQFQTPCYVYSANALNHNFNEYQIALSTAGFSKYLVCYAVKANSNLSILKHFAKLGSGFDIVSQGELKRVIAAGADPRKVVFSGVVKTEEDIAFALKHEVLCFNVESENELLRINRVASQLNCTARISLRVNPNVDAKTHPYISTGLKENKFGIAYENAIATYLVAKSLSNIEITGIDCHIGSQLTEATPYLDALEKVLDLVDVLKAHGITLQHLDLGGGVGITYRDENPPVLTQLYQNIYQAIQARGYSELSLVLEPGRSLVGNAGVLITKVEFLKTNGDKHFALVDVAMNDLMRPALYQAYHDIQTVRDSSAPIKAFDVVGPVCETGDWVGRNRELAINEGDLLAIMSAGAYGMTMASNYNTRNRAAEVLVDKDRAILIRQRENFEQQMANELAVL